MPQDRSRQNDGDPPRSGLSRPGFSRRATPAEIHEARNGGCRHDEPAGLADVAMGRRTFLTRAAVITAGSVAAPVLLPSFRGSAQAATTPGFAWNTSGLSVDGLLTSSAVIDQHVHGAGSEGVTSNNIGASAAANILRGAVDGVTTTLGSEHDWRNLKFAYRAGCDFVGQHDVDPATQQVWGFNGTKSNVGSEATFSFGTPTTPGLIVRAIQAARTSPGVTEVYIDHSTGSTNQAYRGRLAQVVHSLQVTPDAGGLDPAGNSWLEYSLDLSSRPASSVSGQSVPAGPRSLTYRFLAPSAPVLGGQTLVYQNQGALGIVCVAVTPGATNQVACDFSRDIGQCWADMNGSLNGGNPLAVGDNGLLALHWRAVSTNGAPAGGRFNQLRVDNSAYTNSMSAAIAQLVAVDTQFSAPGSWHVGTEISGFSAHAGLYLPPGQDAQIIYPFELYPVNHVGGGVSPTFWQTWLSDPSLVPPTALTVENHPFGSTYGTITSAASQLATAQTLAYQKLMYRDTQNVLYPPLPWRGLEMYPTRAGIGTYGHEAYAMTLWANCQFPVLVGASDNHTGATKPARFLTRGWVDPADPTYGYWDSIVGGRSWLAYMNIFDGTLDLHLGGDGLPDVFMGQIGVMPGVNSRPLQILATGLSKLTGGARLDLVRTTITGAAFTPSYSQAGMTLQAAIVASCSAADLAAGAVTVQVDTSSPSFGTFFHVRVSIPNSASGESTGYNGWQVVALSNPVFHLQQEPTGVTPGVPQAIPSWKTVVSL